MLLVLLRRGQVMGASKKKIALFFFIYVLLFCSLLLAVKSLDVEGIKEESDVSKFSNEFKAELVTYEKKQEVQKQQELESEGWKPSKQFVMTAVIAGSIADIIIVLLWARHVNKKKQNREEGTQNQKIIHQKWFWNIVSMGIVQPKNGKIRIIWRNMIIFIVTMYILKTWFFNHVWKNENAMIFS